MKEILLVFMIININIKPETSKDVVPIYSLKAAANLPSQSWLLASAPKLKNSDLCASNPCLVRLNFSS